MATAHNLNGAGTNGFHQPAAVNGHTNGAAKQEKPLWRYKDHAKAFLERHGRRRYTMVVNAALESEMMDPALSKEQRLLAAIRRYSWGNLSDFAVDAMPKIDEIDAEPRAITQDWLAERVKMPKALVSEGCGRLKAQGYLRSEVPFLWPIDRPVRQMQSGVSSDSPNIHSPFLRFRSQYLESRAETSQRLSELEAERQRLKENLQQYTAEIKKIEREVLSAWRDHRRTNGDGVNSDSPNETGGVGSDSGLPSVRTPETAPGDSRTENGVSASGCNTENSGLLNPALNMGGLSTTTTITPPRATSSSSSPSRAPLSSEKTPPQEWYDRLSTVFLTHRKPAPTQDQATQAFHLVGAARWQQFLVWLPGAKQFKRCEHAGGLPTLIKFFLADARASAIVDRPTAETAVVDPDRVRQVWAGLDAIGRAEFELLYPEIDFRQEVTA